MTYSECYIASKCHIARHGEMIQLQYVRYAAKARQKLAHLTIHNSTHATQSQVMHFISLCHCVWFSQQDRLAIPDGVYNWINDFFLPCSPSAVNSRLYCLGCRTLWSRLTALALFRDTDIVGWSCSSNVIMPPLFNSLLIIIIIIIIIIVIHTAPSSMAAFSQPVSSKA